MTQKEIREKATRFLNKNSQIIPYLECHIDRKRLDYIVSKVSGLKNISGIDCDGIITSTRKPPRGINLDTVERVSMLLAQFAALFDFGINQFKRSTYWRSSYGLKHAFEDFREKIGDRPYYVSNGEFIIAYLIFLHDLQGATDSELESCIRTDLSINAFIRMPRCFDKFEECIRRHHWL